MNTLFLTLDIIAIVLRRNYIGEHFFLTEHYHYSFYMIYNEVNLFGSL
mgnify:CR=1 FL=1